MIQQKSELNLPDLSKYSHVQVQKKQHWLNNSFLLHNFNNFIHFSSTQVMQFGRIDGNAYTLDFQYPFSALQAFSVALANVTQRLK